MGQKIRRAAAAAVAAATAAAAATNDENTDDTPPPANAREYLERIGKRENTPATLGDVVALLEYFGVVEQPAEHAETPYARA